MTALRLAISAAFGSSLLLLAACGSPPLQTTAATTITTAAPAPPVTTTTPATALPALAAPAAPTALPGTRALAPHLDAAHPVSRQRSVFFDYDDDSILPAWRGVIETQGRYLASNPALRAVVEGNTDERGGREYNLALGQRRAEAVRRALLIFGARPAQLEAVSLGEERPGADGHDEAAWQQNRRADLAYQAAQVVR